MAEAQKWAIATEQKRDEERTARAQLAQGEDIAIKIAALEKYAEDGQLTTAHYQALRRIVETYNFDEARREVV